MNRSDLKWEWASTPINKLTWVIVIVSILALLLTTSVAEAIAPSPVADFSATPLSGAEPLTVSFTDTSTSDDGIVSWLWDFGDGQTSTDQNPHHEYIQDGFYTVSLTVTDSDGSSDTETRTDYITVFDTGPAAGFSAAPLSGAEPLTVAFTDTSASYDGIVSWLWDFGDGQTSTEQNPNHVYARDGLYTVSLTVTDS